MQDIVDTSSLLFNETFLRGLVILPILGVSYVLLVIYKQHQEKFKHVPLIEDSTSRPD